MENEIITAKQEGEIILYQPDENIKLEVVLEHDTVWLSQQQMVELFLSTKQNISLHINNIFKEGELVREATVKEYLTVQNEGRRNVRRKVLFYNLDVIISVGYRVKSQRGTQFRIWATNVLKQYLIQGYSVNRQLVALQERLDNRLLKIEERQDEQQQQVDFLVRMHNTDQDRLFPTGCVFDAWEHIASLVRSADKCVTLIDNYCDERTLMMLAKRNQGVECTIHTRFTESFNQDIEKHNLQYPAIRKVQLPHKEHDRFLIIDDCVYILGDSLKNIGHSMTAVIKTSFTPEEVLSKVK